MTLPRRRRPVQTVEEAFGPPLVPEEQSGNLSQLEQRLNRTMKCTAGKNQVYIRSLLTGQGTTRPRIALKCPLRRDIGLTPEVFYEHIRDVCCGNHEECPAWQSFQARHVVT
jgi:hypothetical protein